MIPTKNHPRIRQLVLGEISPSFEAFAFSMCVSRNRRQVEMEGKAPAAVEKAVSDVHEFMSKYESVLAADLKSIFG
jgi:hypothetical protein